MKDTLIKLAEGLDKPEQIKGDDGKAVSGDLGANIIAVLNGIIGILGVVAVAVMIIGGITYMTSAGDAGKVKKAKDTILYGAIGLIIVALSAAIVNFVISNLIK